MSGAMRILSDAELDQVYGGFDNETEVVYVQQANGSYKAVRMTVVEASLYKASLQLIA